MITKIPPVLSSSAAAPPGPGLEYWVKQYEFPEHVGEPQGFFRRDSARLGDTGDEATEGGDIVREVLKSQVLGIHHLSIQLRQGVVANVFVCSAICSIHFGITIFLVKPHVLLFKQFIIDGGRVR